MTTVTSLTLLEALGGGRDERAWREFFRLYAPMLMGFTRQLGLREEDANDAVQETLVAVHAAFREANNPFDRSKGRFKAWLRGIAQHKVRDVQRRRMRAETVEIMGDRAAGLVDAVQQNLDEAFDREWQRTMLARCLDEVAGQVDPVVYQAFELYAVHGRDPREVAKLLGVSRNAIYISKTRVMKRIKAVLADIRAIED